MDKFNVMEIKLQPIGFVRNTQLELVDVNWGQVVSEIELIESLPAEALDGIESFSHVEIIYFFHQAEKVVTGSEHPRENPAYPKVGIFAQRKKDRPNHLGATMVNLIKKEGKKLIVSHLDAIDGTPVLDIKPIFAEFLPKGEIVQPAWTHELMQDYW